METFRGPIQVRWEEDAGASMYGPLTYFIDFLKVSGVWERFVDECPLRYPSRNAMTKNEILGTILFSVLSGHRRYAHIRATRGDEVLPRLWGIEQFRSEGSVRRAFEKQDEEAMTLWMDRHTTDSYAALLEHEWILDLDATVKTLYGRQEEARLGYDLMKPGRPSHVYQAMLFSAAKLVVNLDVKWAIRWRASMRSPHCGAGWMREKRRTADPIARRHRTRKRGDDGRRRNKGTGVRLQAAADQRRGQADWEVGAARREGRMAGRRPATGGCRVGVAVAGMEP